MDLLRGLPVWQMAIAIVCLRIVDVSLGTMRTLSVVQGRIRLSVGLGFFEVLVWITAIAQVVANIQIHPQLMVAYAGGFALGNAVGISLERRLALGTVAIRLVSHHGAEVAAAAAEFGRVVATLTGEETDRRRSLVYATVRRRDLPKLLARARAIDPEVFYVVERYAEMSGLTPLPQATGWRAVFKKK